MGGAGGSLRAGVTENPVRLTRSVKDALTYVSCGGAEAYVWPGGGITVMVDVMDMPTNSFGYVPTPALVAPIEFTLRREDYGDAWRPCEPHPACRDGDPQGQPPRRAQCLAARSAGQPELPLDEGGEVSGPCAALLPGDRLHLQHGPIDLVIGVTGERRAAFAAAQTRFATILEELVTELALLRRPVGDAPLGAVARE